MSWCIVLMCSAVSLFHSSSFGHYAFGARRDMYLHSLSSCIRSYYNCRPDRKPGPYCTRCRCCR